MTRLDDELRATVHAVHRLTPTIVEVVVRAPMAARAFQPGQFYRLQNFETLSAQSNGTRLAMEGLALTGASVDRERGLLSTIVLEMGGSSDLCALLEPGEPVILMGPTGHADRDAGRRDRAAGRRRARQRGAVLDRPGAASERQPGDLLRRLQEDDRPLQGRGDRARRRRHRLVLRRGAGLQRRRVPADKAFVGNIVAAIDAYGSGALGANPIALGEVDRVIAIGSDGMMAAVAQARHGILEPHLKPGHAAIGSINSPMQCMMKEICAQCLQLHRDPATGEESVVFSCFNQDQDLDRVDFATLRARLGAERRAGKADEAVDRPLAARPRRATDRGGIAS